MKHFNSDQSPDIRHQNRNSYLSMTDAQLEAVLMDMDGAALDRLCRAVVGVEPAGDEEVIGIGAATEWRFN